MSDATATPFFLNRNSTPMSELFSWGPCNSSLLGEVPPYSAATSYTARTLALFGLTTPWWERYHVRSLAEAHSSLDNLTAYPLAM